MAKLKHTKNELKAQRDALRRFNRYLPTLQLKKQQLQVEIRQIEARIEEKRAEERQIRQSMETWIQLLSEPFPLSDHVAVEAVRTSTGNIAGVNIPLLQEVVIRRTPPDLYDSPTWVDDALEAMARLLRLRAESDVLAEQQRLLSAELRTTSQRVNLFEKVKIPDCEENIRIIRIFLGDQQTADVARSKIAKRRSTEVAA